MTLLIVASSYITFTYVLGTIAYIADGGKQGDPSGMNFVYLLGAPVVIPIVGCLAIKNWCIRSHGPR